MSRASRARVGLLILHGMGSQGPAFADPVTAELRAALGSFADRVVPMPVFWAEQLEIPERRLWATMREATDADGDPVDLRWNQLRRFLVHGFADALAYDRPGQGSRYEAVHAVVDEEVRALYAEIGDAAPVVVLAHSLGAHVISNYVWDTEAAPEHLPDCDGSDRDAKSQSGRWRAIPTLAGIITFGANIPLFSLAFERAEPIVLPAADVDPRLADLVAWLNFFDTDDVLGWPLRALYDPDTQRRALRTAMATSAVSRDRSFRLARPDQRLEELAEPDSRPAVPRGPRADDDWAIRPPDRAMHCRRRETVRRIRDIRLDAGPFPHNLTPLSHTEYWTDRQLIRPTAEYLRGLLSALDGTTAS